MDWQVMFISAAGFLSAYYIQYKRFKNLVLICPMGGGCNRVVKSDYSRTFGVHNEKIGMAYFIIIFIWGAIIPSSEFIHFVVLVSACSAIFSFYLLFIQFVLLKAWCEWCVLSALSTFALFFIIFL